jgi:hypothetical protein
MITIEDFRAGKRFKVKNSKLFNKTYQVVDGSIHQVINAKNTAFKCIYEMKSEDGFYFTANWKGMTVTNKILFTDCELVK